MTSRKGHPNVLLHQSRRIAGNSLVRSGGKSLHDKNHSGNDTSRCNNCTRPLKASQLL
ncbi:hypothetical protein BGZ61DRAFT_457902 [Ilyonectria robusta]|uniref:uncharacterized protein n=1 Tax=Ilyonectria robusta TaxID=1079257 RepID=UPI001E8CCCD9|nr:uncharacterized protein BGZ61DRAFT_457902 [Ilyonectria robusta]KAH8677253.1 hypothetical protein BGZ61DRAFT_457902 [Ilyonectria robusta]